MTFNQLANHLNLTINKDNDGNPFMTLTKAQADNYCMPEGCTAHRNYDNSWDVYAA